MKKSIYFLLVVLLAGITLLRNTSYGQCPGCAVNAACVVTPAQPTLCPDTLPNGTAMQPYSEDISFYLPATFVDNGSGLTVTFNQLKVLSVSGLPFGLNWQSNSANNTYYPSQNPPATEHGCAKICGTPLIPGNYIVTVFVEAQVDAPIVGTVTQNDNFNLPLTILPSASSNSLFTIGMPIGCAPLTTGFQTLQPSNGHPGFSYLWNFGNGNLSNLENPPAQAYSNPGNYPVSLQTTVDTLGYTLTSVSVLGATSGCDDISVWPFTTPPDFYFVLLLGGTTIYDGVNSYINDSDPPVTFSFSPIQLTNSTYTIQVWDYDTGLAGGDDHCNSDVTFNGYNAGTHTLTSGGLTVNITITHPVITQNATDTIKVYPSPLAGSISYSLNDSVCEGDSITMHFAPVDSCTYQWYNDTSAIYNAIDTIYVAKTSGTYYCEIMNTYGCRAYTNNQHIVVVTNPPKPTFWMVGNSLNTNLTGYDLQWYFEGNPISGATGMVYNFNSSGNYFLVATNSFGCFNVSDTILATYIGIDENQDPVAFKLFPNPNKGSFTLELDLKQQHNLTLRVTDLLGRTVYEEDLGSQLGFVRKNVDLNPVTGGLYNVTINADGKLINQRMSIY